MGHHVGDLVHAISAEETHEVVLEGEVELGLAGVALTAGTTAELVVDASALVTLGADDAEPAGLLDVLVLDCAGATCDLEGDGDHLGVLHEPRGDVRLPLRLLDGGVGVGDGSVFGLDLLGVGSTRAIGLEIPVEERGELLEALVREVELGRAGDALELLGSDPLDVHALLAQVVEGHEAGAAAEQDVRTTTGHVGGDGNGALATSLRHDLRLALVILGVEDVVLDAPLVEDAGEPLGVLDGHGADQAGLPMGMALGDVIGDGVELVGDRAVHEVIVVDADDLLVGRDDLHGHVIDLAELRVLGHGGTCHTRELVVHEEVVLEGDRRERLVLLADMHAFLRLDCLMQALGVAPTLHDAAGELVDDLDLAIHDHVLLVAMKHVLRLERLLQVVDQLP